MIDDSAFIMVLVNARSKHQIIERLLCAREAEDWSDKRAEILQSTINIRS